MQEIKNRIINKADLCKMLNIHPKVAQKELSKALHVENSGVFKIGSSYRIFTDKFFNYLENKDKINIKGGNTQCQEPKIRPEFIKEATSGGFLIREKESNIANQLIIV